MRFWNSILKLDLILASFFSHRFLSLICKSYYISRYSNDNNVAEDVNLENEIIILISFAIHYCVCVSHTHRLSTRIKQKKVFNHFFCTAQWWEIFWKIFWQDQKKKKICASFSFCTLDHHSFSQTKTKPIVFHLHIFVVVVVLNSVRIDKKKHIC